MMQKQKPPFRSIARYLFQYFIPLVAASLILDALALFIAQQWTQEKSKFDLDIASTAISNYIDQIERFAFDISINENVQTLLLSNKSPYISAHAQAEAFDNLLGLNRYYDLEIVHIEVSTPEDVNILAVGYLPVRSAEADSTAITENDVSRFWRYPGNISYYDRTQRNYNVLSYYQKVNQLTSNRYIGYVRIDINVEVLSAYYQPSDSVFSRQLYLNQNTEMIPVNTGNVSAVQEAQNNASLRGNSVSKDVNSDFLLVSRFNLSQLVLGNSSIIILFLFEIVFFIIFFIVMIRFINQLASPIFVLNDAIQGKAPTGEKLSKLTYSKGSREIKVIYDGFNQMVDNINEYIDTNREIMRAEQTTRTLYFQSQINPHFLYNTLDTLRWIALSNRDREVADEIYHLSNIYRYYLNPGDTLIEVKEEVQLIQDYMNLQKLRFKEKFHFQVELSEDAEKILIPKLLIQPLIENSVQHGFSDREENCIITLTIKKEKETLRITATDNGCGMDEATLEKLSQDGQVFEGSFAIANIRKRLHLYYGEAASMTINSTPDVGTGIEIIIPTAEPNTLQPESKEEIIPVPDTERGNSLLSS